MKTNLGYIMPYEPESGTNSAGDFNFFFTDPPEYLFSTEEESIASIEKLLNKRTKSIREIAKESNLSESTVSKVIGTMVDAGKVAIDNFRMHNGIDEAQLKLNF